MPDNWIACKANGHIFGFEIAEEYLILEYSDLGLMFPSQEFFKLTIDLKQNNFIRAKAMEKEFIKARKAKIKQLYCDICHLKLGDSDDYLNHIDKNQLHKELLNEFLEEYF